MVHDLPAAIEAAQQRALEQVGRFADGHSGRFLLKVHDVLDAHFLLADYFADKGEPLDYGLKYPNLLASALDRQVVAIGHQLKWADQFDIIATTFFGLVKNHAFHDGNKRTALLSVLYHLWICGRAFTDSQRPLERLTLAVANDDLNRYPRFKQFGKQDDSEVRYVSWYLRKNSREIDRRDYIVTFRQLDALLAQFGFGLAHPKGNTIDVVKRQTVKRRKGLFGREAVELEHRVCNIGFPGWKAQVSKKDVNEVRQRTRLVPEMGVDSQVFFKGVNPMETFLTTYEGPLKRLATR